MFGIGTNELVIILLFGFLIFGPDKLPAMAKTIGQAIARFRSAQAEMTRVIKTEVYDPDAEDPFKNPLDALSKIENSAQKEDRGESFTARKARYDKQRAAKKAAEERRAETEAKKAAAQAADATKDATSTDAAEDTSSADTAAASSTQGPAKKKLTADELYGTTSKAKKPTAKKAPAASTSEDTDAAKQATSEAASQAKAQTKTAEEATDAPADTSKVATDAPSDTSVPASSANQGEGE